MRPSVLVLAIVLAACGGGPHAPVAKPVGLLPAKEIGLQLTDQEGTRVMRLLPNGQIVIGSQQTGSITPTGEIQGTDHLVVATMHPDGTVEISTFTYLGFKIRDDGVLLREGQPVAQFAADGTLETKLEQNVAKAVAVGDTSQRRMLMFMWAGIVMSANNLRQPE